LREVSRGQARQYARALLQVAEAQGGEDGDAALRLRSELRELLVVLDGHPELQAALASAGVTLPARGRTLAALVREGGASVTLQRFVRLLAERDHLALLPEIVDVYADMVNAARGIVAVQATGATVLDEEQERGLIQALEQVAGGEVELASHVDAGVLGGLRVKMRGRTYDGTVRARLQALRRRLASGS
jgi:F-type H+-transporting ATPase subunit delta